MERVNRSSVKKQDLFSLLLEATQDVLYCENDFFVMKQATDRMYELYTSISRVNASNSNDEEIILPSGKAISPGAAAHCLLELRRTAVFLRGIFKAIQFCRDKNPDRPVSIFYAGCGPYGTLVTPLLTIFAPEELQADFLEINQTSLHSAKEVIQSLGLEKSVNSFILGDAATHSLPKQSNYDIIISETMQSCLDNEPQVAIMQNLVPQMRADAIFIPEAISLDAFMTDPRQEMEKFFYSETPKPPPERIPLGNILKVNKYSLATEEMSTEVKIPKKLSTCIDLHLFTTVTVFADEQLKENDTSITRPKKFYEFQVRYANRIRFWYDNSTIPKIDCTVIEDAVTPIRQRESLQDKQLSG